MGTKIKGITVEIGGDTTKLGKALEDTNSKTKNLQSELKGVNSLLKMDPGNITLLNQKQDILNTSIANTSEKLEQLKGVQEQVQEQFEKGEIAEETYRDFQREIVSTEQKLESLNEQLKEFGSANAQKIAQVGEKFKETGDKISGAGEKLLPLTAGITAVAGAGVAAAMELDDGYDTIITKTGATGEALEGLNEIADNVFTKMPTDMNTVGIAVGEINTRFGATGDKLEDLSQKFIKFSEVNGVDLNNSIGMVDKIMEQWNIDMAETDNVLGLITKKGQDTGISVDGLMASVQQNGATFKEMGLNMTQAVELLAQFEANGVNAEVAIAGLRKSTKIYTDQGKSTDEALKLTIDKIKSAKDETKALALAQETFGTKGAAEISNAIREGRINIDDLSKSMSDYGTVVQDTFDATLNPWHDCKVAINNVKSAASELGQTLLTSLKPVLESAVNSIKTFTTWFKDLSPTMQNTILIIAGVVAAIGPLLIIIGKIITAVGSIMTIVPTLVSAFNVVKGAFASLNAVMAANPIILIVGAIAALVAAFIYLWNNCEAFKNFWINLWENIKSVTVSVVEGVKTFFTENWQALLLLIVNPFAGAFKLLYDNCEGFRNFVNSFIENIKQFFINGANNIVAFFTKTIPSLINSIVKWFNELPTKIGYALGYVLGKIVKFGVDAINWVQVNVPKIINSIVTFFKELPGKVWTWLSNTITKVTTWGVNMTTKAISIGKNFITNVINNIKELPSKLATWFTNTATKVVEFGNNLKKKGIEAGKKLLTSVSEGVKELPNKMASVGKNIVEGVWNGIKNAKDKFMKDIKNFFNGIVDGAKEALDIHSPSRRGEKEIGEEYANGVIKGVKNKYKTAKKTSAELGQILLDTAKTKLEEYKKYNDMSLTSEIAYWQKILASTKKGTQAYKDVNLELKTLKADLNKQLQDLDKSYAESVTKVRETLIKDIQAVSDKYDSAIESRASAITSSMKLFDEFTSTTDKTSEDLLNNLQSQVDGLTHWDELLDQLEARNGMNDELLAELQNMGPSAIADLENIVAMTDEQFEQYVALWTNKQQIADERAVQEYQEYRLECENEVRELIKTANTELNTLEKEYFNSLKELGVSVADESVSIGKKIVDSLKSGVESEREEFSTYLTSFFNQIISTAKNSLKISAVVNDIANTVGIGVGNAVSAATANLIELKQVQQSELLLAGGNGTSVTNNNVKNEVNINTQSVDKNNIDVIVDEINRKLGDKY